MIHNRAQNPYPESIARINPRIHPRIRYNRFYKSVTLKTFRFLRLVLPSIHPRIHRRIFPRILTILYRRIPEKSSPESFIEKSTARNHRRIIQKIIDGRIPPSSSAEESSQNFIEKSSLESCTEEFCTDFFYN